MRSRLLVISTLAAFVAASAVAQTSATTTRSTNNRIPVASRTDRGLPKQKAVIPDPDLLDGSIFEAEQRPLHGMLAEFEMAGQEQPQEQVDPEKQGGGGPKREEEGQGGPPKTGPEAKPEGIQVADLKIPEGAGQQQEQEGGGEPPKPRDLQIGDATLQIQTIPQQAQVVGTQSTSTQQYEKKIPAGQQTDNRNRGVEKGQVMPKGL